MIKQTLTFTSPASLSLKNNQLVIRKKETDEVYTRPIEDIGMMIIENPMVMLTVPLLNELAGNNVGVIFCDSKQMPRSMLQSLESNSTQGESFREQIDISEPCRKQLWKQIVESKIRNQAQLLNKYYKDGNSLKPYYMNVLSGDSDNREGVAAKQYWKFLFGSDFIRDRIGVEPNSLLNYGYTLLRAATARALLGSGLLPAFGLFHRNRYNAFPLADDIMEPYRPFVDELVFELYANGETELDKSTKPVLQRIFFCDVHLGNILRPLEIALTMTTASLLRCYKGEEKKLVLPELQ
jgi:CRISPR-associated protein Cas1